METFDESNFKKKVYDKTHWKRFPYNFYLVKSTQIARLPSIESLDTTSSFYKLKKIYKLTCK